MLKKYPGGVFLHFLFLYLKITFRNGRYTYQIMTSGKFLRPCHLDRLIVNNINYRGLVKKLPKSLFISEEIKKKKKQAGHYSFCNQVK